MTNYANSRRSAIRSQRGRLYGLIYGFGNVPVKPTATAGKDFPQDFWDRLEKLKTGPSKIGGRSRSSLNEAISAQFRLQMRRRFSAAVVDELRPEIDKFIKASVNNAIAYVLAHESDQVSHDQDLDHKRQVYFRGWEDPEIIPRLTYVVQGMYPEWSKPKVRMNVVGCMRAINQTLNGKSWV